MNNKTLSRYSWFVLIVTIGVILWGAYVRATGSGAGCGNHWPSCNGVVIPRPERVETMIEFTHRMSSGLVFIMVVALAFWVYRVFAPGHPARLMAGFSLGFMISEALIGAGLVLFNLVGDNESIFRAFSISLHLANTFLLLASLTLTAWWTSRNRRLQFHGRGIAFWGLLAGLLGMLVLGVSGAIAALGDTLFPSTSLVEGLRQDFSPGTQLLLRLRVVHPFLAVIVGFYLIFLARSLPRVNPDKGMNKIARLMVALILLQLAAGGLNVYLLAPIWLQMVHLLLADLIWITLVLLGAEWLSTPRPTSTLVSAPHPVVTTTES